MALNANNVPRTSSGKRPPVLDEGAYPARLVWVIDLGLQPQDAFKGEPKPPAYALQTVYESSDEYMPNEDGEPDETKPRWFWDDFPLYPLKSDLAKSTKRYYALDPNEQAGGDWAQLIGNPVNIALTKSKGKDGNDYNNVGGTSSVRPKDAAKLPKLINEPKVFDLSDPDIDVFLSLPAKLQEKIKSNLNFEGSLLQKRLKEHTGKPKEEVKKEIKIVKKEAEPLTIEDDSIPFEFDKKAVQAAEDTENDW
jgi:hypothetical protein